MGEIGAAPVSGPAPPNPTTDAAGALAIRARNWRLVQRDSIFAGIVTAAGTFLPVFLVRLGASEGDVALLTSLPVVGFAALVLFAQAAGVRWTRGARTRPRRSGGGPMSPG